MIVKIAHSLSETVSVVVLVVLSQRLGATLNEWIVGFRSNRNVLFVWFCCDTDLLKLLTGEVTIAASLLSLKLISVKYDVYIVVCYSKASKVWYIVVCSKSCLIMVLHLSAFVS